MDIRHRHRSVAPARQPRLLLRMAWLLLPGLSWPLPSDTALTPGFLYNIARFTELRINPQVLKPARSILRR